MKEKKVSNKIIMNCSFEAAPSQNIISEIADVQTALELYVAGIYSYRNYSSSMKHVRASLKDAALLLYSNENELPRELQPDVNNVAVVNTIIVSVQEAIEKEVTSEDLFSLSTTLDCMLHNDLRKFEVNDQNIQELRRFLETWYDNELQ